MADDKCQILPGDVRETLKTLPDGCAQTCVTSPPYYGLRSYNGGASELGQEALPDCLGWATGEPCGDCFVCHLVAVFREVRRVLRADGTIFLNLGDSYANDGKWGGTTGGKHASGLHGEPVGRKKRTTGFKPKDLMGIPWRVAMALQADGWYLRSDCIWSKPNVMPSSVKDRPTSSHEYVFLLSKSERYYYDGAAVMEHSQPPKPCGKNSRANVDRDIKHGTRKQDAIAKGNYVGFNDRWRDAPAAVRNRRTVWTVAVKPYKDAHFATYPPELVKPCILSGTSEAGACPSCGAPWTRVMSKGLTAHDGDTKTAYAKSSTANRLALLRQAARARGEEYANRSETVGWKPSCGCGRAQSENAPCVVLDPFTGSGTTGMVALMYGRRFIGCELNPEYIALAERRMESARAQELFDFSDYQEAA